MLKVQTVRCDFDVEYAKVPYAVDSELLNSQEGVVSFINSFYRDSNVCDYGIYLEMMELAIKTNNITALVGLWDGIYHHDRANPPLDAHVRLAVEFANLETVENCLYAYHNYHSMNGFDDLNKESLLELAYKNPNHGVVEFICTLPEIINPGMNNFEEDSN